MERRSLSSSKSSKVTGKRTKASTTAIPQDPLKRRRITRSMQRKMASLNINMKENTTITEDMMMSQELSGMAPANIYPSSKFCGLLNGQRQNTPQLACKENIVDYVDGLGSSSTTSSSFVQYRPKLQQQLYHYAVSSGHHHALSSARQSQLEVNEESIEDDTALDSQPPPSISHPVPSSSECRTHSNFHQSQFLSSNFSGHVQYGHATSSSAPVALSSATTATTSKLQQTQFCKLKISQLLSCDNANSAVATPLPHLQWVRSADLWRTMRSKDRTKAAPEAELRLHHPEILSNMRIILLDWMMEVCEEYKLHRETYYLAMDMFDRFMDSRSNVQKSQLQLLGVTCLFIASKIEEIYPPKAADFAYVTDGACSVADILDTELIVCKVLNWKLNHNMVTVNTWVNTYMQLGSHHFRPPGVKAKEFEFPAYSAVEFPKVMKLLDLCSLDIASRQFGSSVLAASAVYLQSERGKNSLSMITGFDVRDIQMCVSWMRPFAVILSQKPTLTKKSFSGVAPQDAHNIQTHDVSISMLEDSIELRRSQEATPSQYTLLQDCSVMMTPPRNERRCLAPINMS